MYPSQNGMQNGAGYSPQGGMQSGMQGGTGQGQFVSAPIVSSGTGDIVLQPEKKGKKGVIISVFALLVAAIIVLFVCFFIIRNDRENRKRELYSTSTEVLDKYLYLVSLYNSYIVDGFSTGRDGLFPMNASNAAGIETAIDGIKDKLSSLGELGESLGDDEVVTISGKIKAIVDGIEFDLTTIGLLQSGIERPIFAMIETNASSCDRVEWPADLSDSLVDIFGDYLIKLRVDVCELYTGMFDERYSFEDFEKRAKELNEEMYSLFNAVDANDLSINENGIREVINKYEN